MASNEVKGSVTLVVCRTSVLFVTSKCDIPPVRGLVRVKIRVTVRVRVRVKD